MIGRFSPAVIALAALLVVGNLGLDTTCQAQAVHHYRTSPDLFYNYYVPPGGYGGVPAQMYLSPRPTPPVVGHTYVTYQPLMPHEFLYPHHRKYWRYNSSNNRWTRTMVIWQRSCFDLDCLCSPPKPIQPPRKFGL
jgi:hypothetical protein